MDMALHIIYLHILKRYYNRHSYRHC